MNNYEKFIHSYVTKDHLNTTQSNLQSPLSHQHAFSVKQQAHLGNPETGPNKTIIHSLTNGQTNLNVNVNLLRRGNPMHINKAHQKHGATQGKQQPVVSTQSY
jgi:hypothetical protein